MATDGLVTYVKAFGKAFRSKHYTGRVGAPRLIAWPKAVIGQVVKRYERRRVVGVERRVKRGSCSQLMRLLDRTQGGGVLNTAYIERLTRPSERGLEHWCVALGDWPAGTEGYTPGDVPGG